jgi:phospholipid/cholesterol/gamma-HCH transport system substrate-binding protein
MRTQIRARWARIRVLVTVLVALAIMSTLVYLLSGGGLFKAKAGLRTYFEDSGGLERDAEVDFQGVKIGRVSSVELSHLNDPHRTVEVVMSIDRRYLKQIPDDAKSEIDTVNVLGEKFVTITCQSPTRVRTCTSTVPVNDGGVLEHMPATNVYVSIDMTTFAAQLRSIDAELRDIEEGKGDLGGFVMTDEVYRDLLTGVTNVQNKIEAAVDSKSTLGQLLYSPKQYQDFSASLQRLDANLAELQAGRGALGEFLHDPATYDKARNSLADLRRSVRKAAAGTALTSDELYRQWTAQLQQITQSLDDFNAGQGAGQMIATAQPYESLNGALTELRSTLQELRVNPRKFLRLQIF